MNPCGEDKDGDGIGDNCDNCPGVRNPDQRDTDLDGLGDTCDTCPNLSDDGSGRRENGCPCNVDKKHELEEQEKELRHQAELKDGASDILGGASIGMGILSLILIPFTGGSSLIYWMPAILTGSASVGSGVVSIYENWSADRLREEANKIGELASQYTDGC